LAKPLPICRISLFHKCPSCEKGGIYSSLLTVKDKCDVCGFALKEHDAGDGPAFFAMFIVGTIVTLLAVFVEFIYPISILLHMVFWTPVTIIMSIYLLKVMKSFLIAAQYKHNVLGFAKKGKK
jgi:uncharacterized protein (DUF983 family)